MTDFRRNDRLLLSYRRRNDWDILGNRRNKRFLSSFELTDTFFVIPNPERCEWWGIFYHFKISLFVRNDNTAGQKISLFVRNDKAQRNDNLNLSYRRKNDWDILRFVDSGFLSLFEMTRARQKISPCGRNDRHTKWQGLFEMTIPITHNLFP